MVGTILGPGTIFLMIVGSINVVFGLSQWASFLWNLFPIMAYVIICMTCKAKFQVDDL
jgi:chitin synthase